MSRGSNTPQAVVRSVLVALGASDLKAWLGLAHFNC